MKPIVLGLGLLTLISTGCLNFPGMTRQEDLPRPRAVMLAEPPPPVKADEITETNAADSLRRLEAEIRFDEESARNEASASLPRE